ncbi:MAG: methionine--tRNA ligase subunit beta [Candidatus ainarchaeum sp.]|nr:methionine--tRNA ligase subunit beta [Candidatus ainarchaeum sp.]
MVAYEEFAKLDLRVGRVLECSRVENSGKLLRLVVDIGNEKRQVIAGIGKQYAPEEMEGKNIVMIANLDYRKLAGLESQGMLLAAGDAEIALLGIDKELAPGTKVG